MEKENTDYANFASETKTRVIPSEARGLTTTRSLSSTLAPGLRDGVHIREALRLLPPQDDVISSGTLPPPAMLHRAGYVRTQASDSDIVWPGNRQDKIPGIAKTGFLLR